jgi:hypothetical protein
MVARDKRDISSGWIGRLLAAWGLFQGAQATPIICVLREESRKLNGRGLVAQRHSKGPNGLGNIQVGVLGPYQIEEHVCQMSRR